MKDAIDLKPWLGRLINWKLVHTRGRTKGMTYRISPEMIRSLKLVTQTTLKDIEPHRLHELICTDLKKYKNAPSVRFIVVLAWIFRVETFDDLCLS